MVPHAKKARQAGASDGRAREPLPGAPVQKHGAISLQDMIAGGQPTIEVAPYTPAPRQEPPADATVDPQTFEPIAMPDEPTIGEVVTDAFHATADDTYMPGFAMSDEPLPVPQAFSSPAGGAQQTVPATETQQGPEGPLSRETPAGAVSPADHDIVSPRERRLAQRDQVGAIRYEGRVRILEAFRYLGRMESAPAWVDRNWIGFADYDELRKIAPGPCLRVPVPNAPNFAVCRVGDYVCQQEIVLDIGVPSDVRVEVWAKDDFEKNFLAVAND